MVELWVTKHAPREIGQMAGNRKAAEQVRTFVAALSGNSGNSKALLLHGPPGSGKSLAVRLIAQELNYHYVELNASDKRGKDAIEGYFSATKTAALFTKGRLIVIDEVETLGRGDRGGGQAIISLIKGSRNPVILIANDAWSPKLRSLRKHCTRITFNRIPTPSIEKFLRTVCEKEGIIAEGSVLKSLARFSEGDMRAALTDLQLIAMGNTAVNDGNLTSVGYREQSGTVFNLLPAILRSGKIATSRKLIYDSTKDPDEVFWWIESNAVKEFPPEKLPAVIDILSRADTFRAKVMKQQNWAFKGYMVDMMASVTVLGGGSGYVAYQPPDRFLKLARTKQHRALVADVCDRLGRELHCSRRAMKRDVLPYLKILLENKQDVGLEQEDADVIVG